MHGVVRRRSPRCCDCRPAVSRSRSCARATISSRRSAARRWRPPVLRPIAAYAAGALVVSFAWLRLEDPRAPLFEVVVIVLLAAWVAVLRGVVARVSLLAASFLLAAWLAFDLDRNDYFGQLGARFRDGLHDFDD